MFKVQSRITNIIVEVDFFFYFFMPKHIIKFPPTL